MIKSPFEFFFLSLLSLPSGGIKGEAFLSFFFSFFLLSSFSPAQQWQPLDKGFNLPVKELYSDTIENTIYAGGDFRTGGPGNPYNYPVVLVRWNGNSWDSIKTISQYNGSYINAITKFNNKTFIGGNFGYISIFDGLSWDSVSLSLYGTIVDFYVHNNELYCVGMFDSISNLPAKDIIKFDGINWTTLPVLDNTSGSSITTAIFYKGYLYVGGNLNDAGVNMEDIARFNFSTNQWESVGGGATCDCWINKLYVYHDTLIVAGYFQSLGGMPFNNIAGWDGNNWIDLNGGLMPSNVKGVIEYDDHLYACGQISNLPDGTPINRMAKWDGQQWSDVGLDFNGGTPATMAVLNNDLYIGGSFKTVNGDTMNHIMKYNTSVGINEPITLAS